MFIGREEEIKTIREISEKSGKSLLLYGKRKVGKTTLLKNALKGSKNITVYYECVKSTLKDNVSNFVDRLLENKVIPVKLLFNSMQEVFAYLNTLNMNLNVVIDEYPYLKAFTPSEEVDSIFQNIIDNNIKNINLFISGSHIGMMKALLTEKNALYGRFDKIINLKELNYIETAQFYKEKTIYDKVGFYSVFGGSPFVNSCLDESKTLRENVIETILNPTSAVSNYAEHLLMSDFSNGINAERILFAIANGKKKHKDIEQKLEMERNGLLSKHLKTLTEMEILSKVYPINCKDDRKKVYYEINDNLLRFYYSFVYKNKSALQMLGAESFYDEYIEPSIITFISHRFEEIGRTYFSILVKKGKLKGVLDIGTYYYDDSANKRHGEFDIVLKRKDAYDIYEAKYYAGMLSEKEMLDEERQIQRIKGLNIGNIGFVTVSGAETKFDRFAYIDGEDLYK